MSSLGNSLGLRELRSSAGPGRVLKGTTSPTETGRAAGARTPAAASCLQGQHFGQLLPTQMSAHPRHASQSVGRSPYLGN